MKQKFKLFVVIRELLEISVRGLLMTIMKVIKDL